MRILITGGAGFIGSHLAEHFQRHAAVPLCRSARICAPSHAAPTLSPSSMASSIAGSSVKPAALGPWRYDFSTSSDRAKTPPDLTVQRSRYFFNERSREDL